MCQLSGDPEFKERATEWTALMEREKFNGGIHDTDAKCFAYADKVLKMLQSEESVLEAFVEAPFILNHSTGNVPAKSEID